MFTTKNIAQHNWDKACLIVGGVVPRKTESLCQPEAFHHKTCYSPGHPTVPVGWAVPAAPI